MTLPPHPPSSNSGTNNRTLQYVVHGAVPRKERGPHLSFRDARLKTPLLRGAPLPHFPFGPASRHGPDQTSSPQVVGQEPELPLRPDFPDSPPQILPDAPA